MVVALLSSVACAQVPRNELVPVRVVIRFQQATPGAAPDVLAGLAQVGGVGVRYAAAVSEREYAYVLACLPADPNCERAIAALRAWKRIERIDPDEIKRIRQ